MHPTPLINAYIDAKLRRDPNAA